VTLISKLKTGLLNPKKALIYFILGPKKYLALQAIIKGIEAEIKPKTILEEHMLKLTDINEHLITLYMLTIEKKLRTIVELGTRTGESTIALLEAAKLIDGHVHSIDIDQCLEANEKIKNHGLHKYWTFIQEDDLKVKWNKQIDHLFIDTTHTFNQTLKELQKYEPYVNHGGMITLHDIISYPDTLKAINKYIKNKKNLILYKYFNCNGLAIIFKRDVHT